jgi:hypothetical protein
MKKRRGKTTEELRSKVDLPQSDWKDPDQGLDAVLAYCLTQAKEAEDWYMRKRKSKRIGGRILRLTSVLLVGLGVLIPILAQVYTDNGEPVIAPGWASLALVLAATMVALDRLFGFSTGWARFIKTNVRIERLRHEFEFEWQALRTEAGNSAVDPAVLLELGREFVLAIDEVVEKELLTWSEELHASLDTAADGLKANK